MTVDRQEMVRAVHETTAVFRKGPEATINGRPATQLEAVSYQGGGVVEVFGYPTRDAAPSGWTIHDLHFVWVAVDPTKAAEVAGPLREWLDEYPEPDRLAGGPSYIEFAPAMEVEQETAFRVYAIGEDLGWWSVLIPETLGVTGPLADDLAGRGMVNIMPKGMAPRAAAGEVP